MRRKPGQFGPSPRNPTPRRVGSRVLRTGLEREESEPLSDPRQITARTMYRTPPITSSAPSPMTIILASRFIAATNAPTTIRRNRTGIQARAGEFVPRRFQSLPPAGSQDSISARSAAAVQRPEPKRTSGVPEVMVSDRLFVPRQLPFPHCVSLRVRALRWVQPNEGTAQSPLTQSWRLSTMHSC